MGDTIMHYAAYKKNKMLIEYLITNKASPLIANSVIKIIKKFYKRKIYYYLYLKCFIINFLYNNIFKIIKLNILERIIS